MKKFLQPLIIFVFFIFSHVHADTQFKKSIGFPDAYSEFLSVCETPDSGYVLLGNTTDTVSDSSKIYLVKTTLEGTLVWSKTIQYSGVAFGMKVGAASNGDLVIMGYTFLDSVPYDDIFLIRTQPDGTIIWSKTYGGSDIDEGNDMIIDNDGNIVVAGYTYSFGSALKSGYVIKTDGSGNLIWSKTYSQNIAQEFNGIIQTDDRGYFLCGFTQSPPGINFDGYMVKTDSLGNIDWGKRTGGSGSEILYKAWQDPLGDYYVTGAASTNTASGNFDGWLLKVNSTGMFNNINYTYGSSIADRTYSIAYPPTGGNTIYLSGYSQSNSGFENALFLPIDKGNGLLMGSALFAGTNSGNARAMSSYFSSTGLVQAGYIFRNADTLGSAYLVKYPITISPCQVGVANLDIRNHTFSILYADSLGSVSDSAGTVSQTVLFNDRVVNPDEVVFCILLGENELESERDVELYPNPAKDLVLVRSELTNENLQIQIIDIMGNVCLSTTLKDNEREFSLSGLNTGIYLAVIEGGGKSFRKKVVIVN